MKVSRKRHQHLQRLAEVKKSKLPSKKITKVKNCAKIRKSKPITEIQKLIKRQNMTFECSHYLVGSSSFPRFYRNQYDLSRSNGLLKSGMHQRVETVGKQAFATTIENFIYQPFRISNRIPFICSTPDFIVFSPRLTLIEVKTSEKLEKCIQLFENIPSEYLLQILVSMEVFCLTHAELNIYLYENQSKMRNCYGYPNWVTLIGKVKILKKKTLFTNEMAPKLIQKYMVFLKAFMNSQKIDMSKKDEREIEEMFLACFSTHKNLKVTNKKIRNITSLKHFSVFTNFCKRWAGFDPDDERYGLQNRKNFEKDRYRDVTKNLKLRFIQKKKSIPKKKTVVITGDLVNELLKTENFMFDH